MGARRAITIASVPLLLFGGTGIAHADNLKNDLGSSASGNTVTIASGGSATVKYWLQDTGGCDATASSPVGITINAPSGVTATPASLSFTQCGSAAGNWQTVTFSSSTPSPGYSITHGGPSSITTSPANFTVVVTGADDGQSPTGTVSIDANSVWTNSGTGEVTVGLTATDNVGIVKYRLSETQAGLGSATDLAVSPVTTSFSASVGFTLTGAEGYAKAVWARFFDAAGNSVDAHDTIGWDKTAPVINDDGPTTDANAEGWYKTDVVNTFILTETGSGPDSACATAFPSGSQFKTTSGEGTAVTVSSDGCTDLAGNTASPVPSAGFKVDQTAPVINDDGPTTDANAEGWYKTDVVNTFILTETGSGPDSACATAFPSGSQFKTTSGEGTAVTVSSDGCTDLAGNTASPVPSAGFKVDQTAPVDVAFTAGPEENGKYFPTTVPGAPTCSATDPLSDVASCLVTGYSNAPGTHTMTATATDNAGNSSTATRTYSVRNLTYIGFFAPVDKGIHNTIKGGNTVPLKFRVFDEGVEQTATSVVTGFSAKQTACNGVVGEDAIEEFSSVATGLRYDPTGGHFIQNWKTPAKAGLCYLTTVRLIDGTSISAEFKTK